MHLAQTSILSFLLCSFYQIEFSNAIKDEYYNLYDALFKDVSYKKQIRPATSLNDALVVTLDFYLLSVNEVQSKNMLIITTLRTDCMLDMHLFDRDKKKVEEKQQTLVTSARLAMSWDDDYLEWNSTEYAEITEMMVPQQIVYRPDVVVGNSVLAQELLGYNELPIRLNSEGFINWEPTVLISTDCDIDITYFPFDTQKCDIVFETATSKATEVALDIRTGTKAIELSDFTENGQWELLETAAKDLNVEGGKSKVRFTVLLKRRRTFYVMNIILPVFFLSLTASLAFALPADEGEKMGTGITVLLAFAVYVSIVSEIVPNTSLQVSVLGIYLTILQGQCAISAVIYVFNLRIHFRDNYFPVGSTTTAIIRLIRRFLCINDIPSNQVEPSSSRSDLREEKGGGPNAGIRLPPLNGGVEEEGVTLKSRASPAPSNTSFGPMTWQIVAHTLDNLCFFLFSLMTVAVTLICLLYLHFGSIAYAPTLSDS